jgi:hypothetical protein
VRLAFRQNTASSESEVRVHSDFRSDISNIVTAVVCFLLDDSPASEIYTTTFRNSVSSIHLPAYEGGTDRVFRNVGI